MASPSLFDRDITIFLSYAREDFEQVSLIYDRLKALGARPWMDRRDIVGGEDWERSIWRAARAADFFVICLTERATTKRGFLQREIKRALGIWEEKLQDDIFLIPVRLEECSIPDMLGDFQWIDLYRADGFDRLIEALRIGAERRDLPFRFRSDAGEEVRIVTKSIRESLRRQLAYEISIDYPQIEGSNESWQREINSALEGYAINLLHEHRKAGLEGIDDEELGAGRGEFISTSTLDASFDVPLFKNNLLSIQFGLSTYGAGAAHHNYHTETRNYLLNPTLNLHLGDLFKVEADYLSVISALCIEDLTRQFLEIKRQEGWQDEADEDYISSFWWDGAAPKEENFEDFIINETGLVFHFDPYQVAAYALGSFTVEIPFVRINGHVDTNGPLKGLL